MSSFVNNGVVTYYNPTKKFGFIITEENQKIFFNSDKEFKENQEVYIWYNKYKNTQNGRDPKAEYILPKNKNDIILEDDEEFINTPPKGIYKNQNSNKLINLLTGEEYPIISKYVSNRGTYSLNKNYYIFGADSDNIININGVDYPIKNQEPIIYNDRVLNVDQYKSLQNPLNEEEKRISSLWEEYKKQLGINVRPQEQIVPTEWDDFEDDEVWSDDQMFNHFSNIENNLHNFKCKLNTENENKFLTRFILDLDESIDTFIYEGISYGIK